MRKGHDVRPTLLLVGRGEPMEAALRVALDRHGMAVESAATASVVEAVTAAAPDLVVLMGDAVGEGGVHVLRHLAENPTTSVIPVALLSNDTSLDQRLRAFRSGAVAVVQRGASADAIARQVAQLARELPERPGQSSGVLGEATLEELVELVSRELRSGILSVEPQAGRRSTDPVRVVLGAGGPVAEALQDFVERLRPLIAKAEPLRYELLEESGGRLRLFDSDDTETADLAMLRDLRILVMDNDPGRADILAQALRDHGSLVGVTDVSESGLERAQTLEPEVVILDSTAIEGSGFEAVRSLRRDTRLRWASLLVARWDELWPAGAAAPDLEQLAGRIAPLTEHDRTLRQRALSDGSFDTRLELTGPSRLLRTLVRVPGTRHVVVRATRATIEVDLADGLVVGAQGTSHGDAPRPIEGMAALAGLLNLSAGRVRIEGRGHPSVANVMLPVDEALARAAREDSPVKPSVLPPAKKPAPIRPPGAYGSALRATGGPTSPAPRREGAISDRAARPGVPFPSADALRSTPPPAIADEDATTSDEGELAAPVERAGATAREAAGGAAANKGDLRWEDSSADKRLAHAATEVPPRATSAGTPPGAKSRYVPPPPPPKRPSGTMSAVPAARAAATVPAPHASVSSPHASAPSPHAPLPAAPAPRSPATAAPARKRTILGVAPVGGPTQAMPVSSQPSPGVNEPAQPQGRTRSGTLLGAGAVPEGFGATGPAAGGGTLPASGAAPEPSRSHGLPPVLADEPAPRAMAAPVAGVIAPDDPFSDVERTTPSAPRLRGPDSEDAPLLDSGDLSGLQSLPPESVAPSEGRDRDPTKPVPLARDSTDLSSADLVPAGTLPPAALVPAGPRSVRPPKSRTPRRIAFVALGMTCGAIAGGAIAFFTRPTGADAAESVAADAPPAGAPAAARAATTPSEPAPARTPGAESDEPTSPAAPEPAPSVVAAPVAELPAEVAEAAPAAPPEVVEAATPAATGAAAAATPVAAGAGGAPTAATPGITPDAELPSDRARASDVLVADAIALLATNRLDLAEQALGRAMELDRNNPQGFETLARLHLARRDFDRAIGFAEEAVRVRRRRGEYYVLLGDCLLAAGRADDAREAWRRGLRAEPIRELRDRLAGNGG